MTGGVFSFVISSWTDGVRDAVWDKKEFESSVSEGPCFSKEG